MEICNQNQIRQCDEYMIKTAGYPSFTLMENAVRAFTQRFLELCKPDAENDTLLVLCGIGNNGGDGMGIARCLHLLGYKTHIWICGDPEAGSPDVCLNFKLLKQCGGIFESQFNTIFQADYIIDALIGTGLNAEVRGEAADCIEYFRAFQACVVAVDLPSGLSANTGEIFTAPIPANYSLTFHRPKVCHYVSPASEYCGKVEILDIGIFPAATEAARIQMGLADTAYFQQGFKMRSRAAHKGKGGHALVCGGSKGMPGAVALAARAAFRAGAGKVSVWVPESIRCEIHMDMLEVMSLRTDVNDADTLGLPELENLPLKKDLFQSYCVGPGMGTHRETAVFLKALLKQADAPCVLDADALNLIAAHSEIWDSVPQNSIITPHPGEMARLCNKNIEEIPRLETALAFAQKYKVIVVLKGLGTLIASPEGNVMVCPYGNAVLATAGTGDILSGIIAGFLASGYPPFEAAVMGVVLHAYTADYIVRGQLPGSVFLEAGKVLESVPEALQALMIEKIKN